MSTATQRPTPECDAYNHQTGWTGVVPFDFARKLEGERDEAREQLESMREAIKEAYEAMNEMLTAFDSETARRYYTATFSGGWTMLEIGACSSGRAALRKLQLFIKT